MFDELHWAVFFTELDLTSSYHQVRSHPPNTYKITFRTHNGHYEYLVMPFGLYNAPSTFQAIMNTIFRPYLRRFILVFFDDILIYSPNWELHLEQVLQILNSYRKSEFSGWIFSFFTRLRSWRSKQPKNPISSSITHSLQSFSWAIHNPKCTHLSFFIFTTSKFLPTHCFAVNTNKELRERKPYWSIFSFVVHHI